MLVTRNAKKNVGLLGRKCCAIGAGLSVIAIIITWLLTIHASMDMSAEERGCSAVERQITHVLFDLDGLLLGMCVGDWRLAAKPPLVEF